VKHRTILNDEGRYIGSYKPSELEKYYKLLYPERHMITGFVEKLNKEHDTRKILTN